MTEDQFLDGTSLISQSLNSQGRQSAKDGVQWSSLDIEEMKAFLHCSLAALIFSSFLTMTMV